MPTPASPAGTWCNHTLEQNRSTLGRSSGEAFMPRRCFLCGFVRTKRRNLDARKIDDSWLFCRYGCFADFSGVRDMVPGRPLCPQSFQQPSNKSGKTREHRIRAANRERLAVQGLAGTEGNEWVPGKTDVIFLVRMRSAVQIRPAAPRKALSLNGFKAFLFFSGSSFVSNPSVTLFPLTSFSPL